MHYTSAEQCWQTLLGVKESLLRRCERYASLTIPKICLPDGFNADSTDQTHDYQSIGAQATNHLTNKIMLATFAPSRPFFRVDAGDETKKALAADGMDESDITAALGKLERDCVKELDSRAQRPKLYSSIRHLIVTGNALLCLMPDKMRVMGIRYYCVKRNANGDLYTLIIKETLKFDELDPAVQEACAGKHSPDTKVSHYRWIQKNSETRDYEMTQWVDTTQLPEQFNGKWAEDKLPYRVLTWDLADEADYGTGLVEEYCGDLEALSILSESVVDGAVLGTEYRWMVDPISQTSVEDLQDSKNGDFLPGKAEDVVPTQGGNPQAIAVAEKVLERYERRVALGFLMNSAMTRDAERVTAEEIRMTANELETAFGGVYSTLANGLQMPVALWLMAVAKMPLGLDLKLSIITGLDALSRNGDLENLRLALADLAQIALLPEMLQTRINFQAIADYIGNGRGIDLRPFLKSEEEVQEIMRQQQAARVQESNATEAGAAAAQATAQQGVQQ